jgi:hypothetical protein
MAKVLANIIGYGGDASGVWVAPKGTTGPTGLTAPAAGFKEVGWLSEDGVSISRDEDRQTFRAHQGGKIVKRKTASVDDTIKFQCLETNAVVLGLLYKQTVPAAVTGVVTISVANQTVNDERAWVVDEKGDDGSTMRYVIPNGTVGLTADIVYKTDEMTVYEFTLGINGDYTVITDAAGVVTPA